MALAEVEESLVWAHATADPTWINSRAPTSLISTSTAWRAAGIHCLRLKWRTVLVDWFGEDWARPRCGVALRNALGCGDLGVLRLLLMIEGLLTTGRASIRDLPSTRLLRSSPWNSEMLEKIEQRMAVVLAGGAATLLHLISLRECAVHLSSWTRDLDANLFVTSDADVLAVAGDFVTYMHKQGMDMIDASIVWRSRYRRHITYEDLFNGYERYACELTNAHEFDSSDTGLLPVMAEYIGEGWKFLADGCWKTKGFLVALYFVILDSPPYAAEDFVENEKGSLYIDIGFLGREGQVGSRFGFRATICCRTGENLLRQAAPVIESFDIDVCRCGAVKHPDGGARLRLFRCVSDEVLLGNKLSVVGDGFTTATRIAKYARRGWKS